MSTPPTVPSYIISSSSNYIRWTPNTGANHHMTLDSYTLYDIHPYQGMDHIRVGNGQGLPIVTKGTALYSSPNSSPFKLNDVYHVPSLTKSLLFVQKFTTDNSCFFEF